MRGGGFEDLRKGERHCGYGGSRKIDSVSSWEEEYRGEGWGEYNEELRDEMALTGREYLDER